MSKDEQYVVLKTTCVDPEDSEIILPSSRYPSFKFIAKYFLYIPDIFEWYSDNMKNPSYWERRHICMDTWHVYWLELNGMSESRIKELIDDDCEYKYLRHWPLLFDSREECKIFWETEMGVKFVGDYAVNIINGIVYGNNPKVI